MTMNRVLSLLVLVLLVAAGCRPPQATVTSQPPASVWEEEDLLGQTPLSLPSTNRDRSLILRQPGYQDAAVSVPAGHRGEVPVTLEPLGGYTLTCTSQPSGASVYLDGERMGETPLTVRDLDRDVVEVTFQLKNHEQVMRAVHFDERPTQELAVVLPSLTEKYYLQQLRQDPDVIHPYCDLAHHYVLQHEFAKAVEVFGQGVDLVVRKPGTEDSGRLWSEIDRVTTKQYDFGDAQQVAAARKALAKGLAEMLNRHGNKSPLELYVAQIDLLDTLDQRQGAQDLFEQAWKAYPNQRQLQQTAKQRRFHIP